MKQRINALSEDDKKALSMLAHCGNASTKSMLDVGLSRSRIESMKRDHLISSADKNIKYGHRNDNAVWGLTPKGKTFVSNNLMIQKCACGTNAVKHNTAVAKEYSSIVNRDDIKTILNEHEARQFVQDKIEELKLYEDKIHDYYEWKDNFESGQMSMPDITVITREDNIECYEVTTNNYGEEELIAKQMTVTFLDAEYTEIKV